MIGGGSQARAWVVGGAAALLVVPAFAQEKLSESILAHDPNVAQRAERIIRVQDGAIVSEGTPPGQRAR